MKVLDNAASQQPETEQLKQPKNGLQTQDERNNKQRPDSDRATLDAGQWARQVAGLKAPFGHDGLPTVWG